MMPKSQILNPKTHSTLDADDVARFSQQAAEWWNPEGPFRPLHRLNPVRLGYIRDRIMAHYAVQAEGRQPLQGLTLLDIGCGGGLVTEPLARLGAKVTGLDASETTIGVAASHATTMGLTIDYRCSSVEALAATKPLAQYDVIIALEIIEHVADPGLFLQSIARLLKPGGLLIMSTLNRTPKSFLLGIVAAEYLLGWVPRGTHQWRQFIRPSELAARLESCGLKVTDLSGLTFNPLTDSFELKARDLGVNYLLVAVAS
jgi:2-polyprenyl-6-hydroxyphenyl methylase/3-demethylubiquinone-9 3-methyltransferase